MSISRFSFFKIPPEQYIDRAKVGTIDGINITDRPNDVWEPKEIREITIKSGDTLVDIINPYFMNEHFRMNYEWYAKQVLKLNNITDPHCIKAGNTLKIPIYFDMGTK
jgi:aspartate carbamoyltransferase regulatory subunit